LSFLGEWGKHIYLFGTFFQRFEDVDVAEDESDLIDIDEDDSPELNASGGISVTYKRLRVQLNFTWRNEQTNDVFDAIFWSDPRIGNPAWFQPGTINDPIPASELRRMKRVTPADLRLDLTASFRISENFSIDFSARNITESNPFDSYYLQDGSEIPYYGQLTGVSETSSYGINFTIGISGRL
jgi:hypothetical protein